jgi:hypothetical protein
VDQSLIDFFVFLVIFVLNNANIDEAGIVTQRCAPGVRQIGNRKWMEAMDYGMIELC